jgi:hypothetical protein
MQKPAVAVETGEVSEGGFARWIGNGGVVATDERQLRLQASRCYEFHGPTFDVF